MSVIAQEKPVEEKIPDAVANFLNMELSASGLPAKNLVERIDADTSSEKIALSDIIGPQPAHITQQMETWYNMYIAAPRSEALHAVSQLCKDRCSSARGEGFLLALRLATFDDELLQAKRDCYKNHKDKFLTTSQSIAKLESDLDTVQHRYDVRKSQFGGREAQVLNRPLYFFVMIFVLFASEAALNLESFEALPWATPAIAWGATIIIGIAIGLAAHFHGTVLKQYDYYFNPAEDDTKRGPAWRMVAAGSATLFFALSFVYYARSAYLISYTSSLGGFGQTGSAPNFLWVVGGSLLGNVLVYLTGSLWAYIMHDRDPEFVDWKVQINRTTRTLNALKQRMERARAREIEQIIAKHKRNTEQAKIAYQQVQNLPAMSLPLDLFNKIQAKDSLVVALLMNYRQILANAIGPRAKEIEFEMYCDEPYNQVRTVGLAEFLRNAIRLKYLGDI